MVKPNKIRHILASAIVLATLYIAVSLALKLGSGGKKEEGLPALPRNVEISLSKIHYTETKDGVRQWDLFAGKGEYDKARDVTRLTDVRLVLHERGKEGEITLVSDRADYFNASKVVVLTGNVVAKSEGGMEFVTGRASYQSKRSLVVTDDRVRFTDGGMSVSGVGMELSVKTRQVRILRDVTATVAPGKKG
ncbi:LPS export ABC transporter periplasmic protein LptC [Geobacter hydrogenophilus]|uniref:LPS export ABC transporter periplasmic protein LptC n=1 Tax=Geobacter hydrogenophilus TaxID=40983 RepID=A0A9W6FXH7_9BACT|nr:LPS export ABC transporter periplasmic protein LptC [Geobacter hydrogenophilus]MBT0894884.1 LPS export ABC transporter periplasmic protein LptC [Geobacter hydrogenophilus]GLI36711.1 LPS export ABC transporter periplasmic protein LptC [Geobacter hydrogenophilus]